MVKIGEHGMEVGRKGKDKCGARLSSAGRGLCCKVGTVSIYKYCALGSVIEFGAFLPT